MKEMFRTLSMSALSRRCVTMRFATSARFAQCSGAVIQLRPALYDLLQLCLFTIML